ncbi:ATP-dependent DNA helicase RecQ [Roseisolibacter sp. H3M3-2]|uniref:RecQ family ATP-dependent DNA helicase n=1 Tax=Roseisolibacter sp. H3M3-2 TaxID=3031323 RepID=UPI0023D9D587|nr:ATP-dependent DNA helicase RecQ [Roseisolibacter sp. H3M3-2]MDF1503518.1 RecQ family ATP-dependent DNA helicase [Roseisolibacter sp. H3M3-2]
MPPVTASAHAPTLDDARALLRARFGYPEFRAGQERAVQAVLEGRDTLVILPTGGGKSLCFQVPALVLPGLTVVVSPLISLMKDQVDALTARGLPAAFVNSTLTSAQANERFQRAARGELKLLYVAPERFDFGNTAERLRDMGVSLLAVDEAHCISEWGHDFRPSYLRMRRVRAALGDPVTIALTATATPEVRRDIAAQLDLRDPETVITGFDRQNLHYHVVPVKGDREKDQALADVLARNDGQAVVYASTRKAVERVTEVLGRARIPAVAYHAGLDDAHRHEVQDAFMHEQVRAIVATNAFGMGIDKPNVRLVVHHAMPGSLEAYYQEAGRAGRDGLPSEVFLLHSFPDRFTHEFFIKGAYPERKLVEQVHERLRRDADRTGLVDYGAEELAVALPGKVSAREVESALRVLAQAEVLRSESESPSRVFVRLLATPERIKRELGGDPMSLELLRALWRVAGKQLETGAVVDLDTLPPGLGGGPGALPVLEALQGRQFVVVERAGGGMRLADPRRPLADAPVDWHALERRRRAELSKLDAMQRYAYHTGCRRHFVLRYFGDPAAGNACSGCDNCLGVKHEVVAPALPTAVPKPGGGRSRSRASGGGRESAPAPAQDLVMGPEDAALFGALKALRGELARAEQVPAYVVFPDRTLAELAVRRPRTLAAMGEVRGVGPAKLEKYGPRFLAALRNGEGTEAA